MRISISVILLFVFPVMALSQRAYDGECILGLDGRIMSFHKTGQPTITIPNNDYLVYSYGSSSICNTEGELAFGCTYNLVFNKQGDSIDGWRLNYVDGMKKFWDWTGGVLQWNQQSIVLPKTIDEYYVFTYSMSDNAYDDWISSTFFRTDMLTYHVVDMKKNNGMGKVSVKNQILMKDAVLSSNRLTAVKHGNGRDWWLVAPHQKEHIFYLFLVTPDGVSGPFTKSVDYPVIDSLFGGQYGQSSFNRNGDKYAYCTHTTGGVFVLNFDRCTGEFSKYHFYKVPNDTSLSFDVPIGNQFSPNDSFLYVNTMNKIFQIDINDTSSNSLQFIHGPDVDSANEFFQKYSNIYLGGDDKLYIGNFHGVKSTMSYIEQPNKRGVASNFCRRCLQIPNNNAKGLPNLPNYHLGKKVGSECDTISEAPTWEAIRIYPNPVSNALKVYLPLDYDTEVSTILYTISGQRIMSLKNNLNYRQEYSIDMSDLAKGVYLLRVESDGKVWKEKVVKE